MKTSMEQIEEIDGSGSEDANFPLLGYRADSVDTKGAPLLRWDEKGKSVTVSTDLPCWKRKLTSAASAVTSVLYGKKNMKEVRKIKIDRLAEVSAQSMAWSAVLNHCLGRSLNRAMSIIDNYEAVQEKQNRLRDRSAYDRNNPAFQIATIPLMKDAVEFTIERLKEEGCSIPDDKTFDNLFPELALQIADIKAKQSEEGTASQEEETAGTGAEYDQPGGDLLSPGRSFSPSSSSSSTSSASEGVEEEEETAEPPQDEQPLSKRHKNMGFEKH